MTAEDLKVLYETQLRHDAGDLGLSAEERQALWHLFSASRRMQPGELREQDHSGVWLWSDLHLGHAMTLSVFGRPYWTPEEMDDDLFGARFRACRSPLTRGSVEILAAGTVDGQVDPRKSGGTSS